ncbi:tRNA pseudouridine synthase B [[Clostridium] ultunense Esp]|nr:tRNA pseudouridine synthase B [[Clostridium] ultunense Esp]
MRDGILVVAKPRGLTSHDVIQKVRRFLGIKRIGHAGTLDPEATGVLPLCIGRATKIVEYIQDRSKTYVAEWTGGIATDTEDQSGNVVERINGLHLTWEEVTSAFTSFIGPYAQTPPMYSAVKVKGKRLYELARQGKEVERTPRLVTIYDLMILDGNLEQDPPKVRFQVRCSKGTYIRTLCVDIGKKLGIPAHMSDLIRVESGGYHLEEAHSLEEIEEAAASGKVEELISPLEEALSFLPSLTLSKKWAAKVIHGAALPRGFSHMPWKTGEKIRLVSDEGRLMAVYQVVNGEEIWAKPEKILFTEDPVDRGYAR